MTKQNTNKVATAFHSPRRLVAFVVAATLLAAVVTTAASSGHPSPAPKAAEVSSRLKHAFGIFAVHARSAATTSEPRLPVVVANGMESTMNVAAAAYAGGIYPAWVVPGSSMVCLVVEPTSPEGVPSSDCGPIADVEKAGLAVVITAANGARVIVGLAPNGNSAVRVAEIDGTTETVPVVRNVYDITAAGASSVTLNGVSGARLIRQVGGGSAVPMG